MYIFFTYFRIKINTLKLFLLQTSKLKFVLVFTVFTFLASFITVSIYLILTYVFNLNIATSENVFKNDSFLIQLVFVCILAPVLETYVFQYFFYELFFIKRNYWLALIFSSALFGLSHFYDPMYAVNTFFSGLVLGLSYIMAKKRKTYPILLTIMIHALHNFIIVMVETIAKAV